MAPPSIVFGRDIDGEDYYTVLELIEDPDLSDHLTRSGQLPWLGIEDSTQFTAHYRVRVKSIR